MLSNISSAEIIATLGGISSPLITILVLWKVGLIGKNSTLKNGNTSIPTTCIDHLNFERRIKETEENAKKLNNHAEIANQEMGEVKKDIALIQKDISYIRQTLQHILAK